MKRNCNLELRLFPAGIDEFDHDSTVDRSNQLEEEITRQPITIFYGGQVCVCDVTELQARAILSVARREMDQDKLVISPERSSSSSSRPVSPITLPSPQVYGTDNGLSMKKSLQRFLQKRKTRIQATSPYNIGQPRRNGVLKSFLC